MVIALDLAICNEALAECPEDPIQSAGEPSIPGRECRRAYGSVVTEILAMSDWESNRKRQEMAAVTNDRPDFWPYAYALPDDLSNPLKLVPSFATYDGLYFDQYLADGSIVTYPNWPLIYQGQYEIAEQTFYSFEPIGVLEYTSNVVNRFTPLLRRAIVLTLASRIVLPITKSVQRQTTLIATAAAAVDLAKADNMNRQPRSWVPTGMSSIQQARAGWSC